jgi:hypothetical protein
MEAEEARVYELGFHRYHNLKWTLEQTLKTDKAPKRKGPGGKKYERTRNNSKHTDMA